MRKLSIILFLFSILACKKDEIEISLFIGNDIDSVVYYNVMGSDTIPIFAQKFTYSDDKNTIYEQWYERVEGEVNLIPTVFNSTFIHNNKIIINDIFSSDTSIITYRLNGNKHVIWRTRKNTKNYLIDSIAYNYSIDNYLQSAVHYNYQSSGEDPRRDTLSNIYFWANGNISKVKYIRRSNDTRLNEETHTTYIHSNHKNPLTDNYLKNHLTPYLKYGRSERNLVSKETTNYSSGTYGEIYSYILNSENSSYLTMPNSSNNSTYKIFYK